MAKDDAVDVEEHDEHLFLRWTTDFKFLWWWRPWSIHIVDCSFDYGSYRLIHVSSAVTILLRKSFPSRLNGWTKRRHDSTLCAFWHSDNSLGIHLAHSLLMFKFSWIIVCTVPTLHSIRWLTSLTVIRLALTRISLISWTFCDVIDVGRPLRCSSITLSYPFSYREYHLCNACRSLHCSIAICIDQNFHSFFSVFSH